MIRACILFPMVHLLSTSCSSAGAESGCHLWRCMGCRRRQVAWTGARLQVGGGVAGAELRAGQRRGVAQFFALLRVAAQPQPRLFRGAVGQLPAGLLGLWPVHRLLAPAVLGNEGDKDLQQWCPPPHSISQVSEGPFASRMVSPVHSRGGAFVVRELFAIGWGQFLWCG
jgi:hypothetical protein